ncbi:hypothetical protein [Pseudomonas sp. Z18(2022)]|uniref:hypothetical protein n=1 Tax=Pseudomonas sp. Z18(2022) TaxID=2983410 RepID=UPI002E80E782|nr:hypothetical protein [Pseudomonas sp. Z18(2022)]
MTAKDMPEGQLVPGYVTFVGSEASWATGQFMSFSYSVNGQHFHKSLNETVDAWSTATLRKATEGLRVGDRVSVWCSLTDPGVCCIGEKPAEKPRILRLIETLGSLGPL